MCQKIFLREVYQAKYSITIPDKQAGSCSARIYDDKPSCLPTILQAHKPPKKRVLQQDKINSNKTSFTVKSFGEIGESLLEFLDSDCKFSLYDKHIGYYKTVIEHSSIPQIAETIRIDSDRHVKLFYKGFCIPFPDWFRKTSDCKFTSKDMLPNFSTYIRQESERWDDVLDELRQLRYKKFLFI